MLNFLDDIKADPGFYRQLRCDGQLVTEYTCPLENPKQDLWCDENYFVYVLEGRKGWIHAGGEVILGPGECAFVRKGASIVEQYLEQPFCLIIFFLTDEFICENIRSLNKTSLNKGRGVPAVIPLQTSPVLHGFFQGMLPHFREALPAQPDLLRLKFRELILTTITDPRNTDLLSFFCSMLNDPAEERLRRVMEDNYCFNLSLHEFARLCGRSVSAFKRDFQQVFRMPPGKWLKERRLERARVMLLTANLQVSEIAFQCGFENLSHFSRVFREVYDETPVALRRKHQTV